MKTNTSARWFMRVRVVLFFVVLAAIAGLDFRVSELLAARIGQSIPSPTDGPQAPNVGLSDWMAAAR
jgi:hypothetical protein